MWIFSGVVRGDLLDIHAAFAARHQHNALLAAVDDHADVILFGDLRAFFNQQAPDVLPLRAGLVGNQLHAQYLARVFAHFSQRLRHFHAAALAAPARVDLRLDHPHFTAELSRRSLLPHRQ